MYPPGTIAIPSRLRGGGGGVTRARGDYRYLEDVVRIRYPVRDARAYLNRHLGNHVQYELVEARRGEEVGEVREGAPCGEGERDVLSFKGR